MQFNPATRKFRYIPATCGRLACPDCGPRAQARYMAQVVAGTPERHVVLTFPRDLTRSLDENVRRGNDAFTDLVRWIRRLWPGFEYMKSWELHKSGMPHIHVACRGDYIPHRMLKAKWHSLTGATIVWITAFPSAPAAAREMAKYLTKSAAALRAAGSKRFPITHSKHWLPDDFKLPRSNDDLWKTIAACCLPGDGIVAAHRHLGCDLVPCTDGSPGWEPSIRDPPDLRALAQAELLGSRAEQLVAAVIRESLSLASAPGASADDVRDHIGLATDPREPF